MSNWLLIKIIPKVISSIVAVYLQVEVFRLISLELRNIPGFLLNRNVPLESTLVAA
jgi:hypothetical protein